MKVLTIEEQFNLFMNTLNRLSTVLEIEKDEELEYVIYEDLDIDVNTTFHESLHDSFLKSSMETEKLKENVTELRKEFITLINRQFTPNEIRTDPNWRKVIEQAQEISSLLKG